MNPLSALRELVVSLTYPPTLSLLVMVLAGGLWFLRWKGWATAVAGAGLAWSLLWSLPVASEALRGQLEQRYPRVSEESQLPQADAIVVLGGGSSYRWMDRPDVDADDLQYSRLAAGARAWEAGRAPVVILSGGGNKHVTEAARMAQAIQRLGVPASALRLEERSFNTQGNAINSVALAGKPQPHLLLVTSALHMPRAAALFEDAGAKITAVPVPEGRARNSGLRRWLPSPRALWRSGRALKEYVALVSETRGVPAQAR